MTGNAQQIPPNANMLLAPAEPTPGALGAFAKFGDLEEVRQLEMQREQRVWEVRAILSDNVPLSGDADAALSRPAYHMLHLNPNEDPLWIYLHSGGRNAIYYELVGDANHKVSHIAVRVESCLPSNALLLARRPLNGLLDIFTRDSHMPLLIERLELIAPSSGRVLITETLLPQRSGVVLGPLGGFMQFVPFAPYDALYREALTTSSPFYRVLCAWKIYEGTQRLREWIREECTRRGINERMPSDPEVNKDELLRMGMQVEFVEDIKRAGDLFEKLKQARNAIAHFLIEDEDRESHVYVADGRELHAYAIGSAALLRYAHKVLEDLRRFCGQHSITGAPRGGTILPMSGIRDQFIVRAKDYGLE